MFMIRRPDTRTLIPPDQLLWGRTHHIHTDHIKERRLISLIIHCQVFERLGAEAAVAAAIHDNLEGSAHLPSLIRGQILSVWSGVAADVSAMSAIGLSLHR